MKEFVKSSMQLTLRFFKACYWWLLKFAYRLKWLSVYNIPVIINNFNRLTFPLQLLEFLEKCGFTNIVILDNNSTYPKLLKFYENCKYEVIRQHVNHGHLAFWKSGLYHKYKWNYFIYTDADVVPIEECPEDFIVHFVSLLTKNYQLDKIGFGIKIDDLPDSFSLKKKVTDYEKRYWKKEVAQNVYDAPIDTTFALYKPFSTLRRGEIYTLKAFRTGPPYLVRHLPWYVDSLNLSEEESYYLQTCGISSSLGKQKNKMDDVY